MADPLKPYADDESSMTVGGLSCENGLESICISGSLDIARDQQGLEHARALRDVLAAIVTELEAASDLPARAAKPKPVPVTRKPNPFA